MRIKMQFLSKNKSFGVLFVTLTVSLTACSIDLNESNASQNTDGPKLAYILEKIATPTKWDPKGSQVVTFRHCVQRSQGSESIIESTYQLHVDEIKFDLETAADAKANNYEISSPPIKTNTASLLAVCPQGAIAICDKGTLFEHYYTDATWVLDGFEKSCGYSGSDVWRVSN